MMEGLKEALQYIAGLKAESMEPKVVEIGGKTYCNKDMRRYHSFDMADEIRANTLTAVVDYIKGKPEELRGSIILHVMSPTEVKLYSGLIDERDREYLLRTSAIMNEFQFDHYYDQERFLIELQSNFIPTEDLESIMKVAGNIKAGTTANYDDDGISQPESAYVFRIKDSERGPAFKLVEADGGLWKNAAMKQIKEYLEQELSEELKEYHITVIA